MPAVGHQPASSTTVTPSPPARGAATTCVCTNACFESMSRTARRSVPVPLPWMIRSSRTPARAASSNRWSIRSKASSTVRPRRSSSGGVDGNGRRGNRRRDAASRSPAPSSALLHALDLAHVDPRPQRRRASRRGRLARPAARSPRQESGRRSGRRGRRARSPAASPAACAVCVARRASRTPLPPSPPRAPLRPPSHARRH